MLELWWIVFGGLFFCFTAISLIDIKYFSYFPPGVLLGFYFDSISISNGWYSYVQYWPSIWGVPLTVTIGEGCAVVMTMFIAIKGIYLIKTFIKKNQFDRLL